MVVGHDHHSLERAHEMIRADDHAGVTEAGKPIGCSSSAVIGHIGGQPRAALAADEARGTIDLNECVKQRGVVEHDHLRLGGGAITLGNLRIRLYEFNNH
jgi:hypothetical protein